MDTEQNVVVCQLPKRPRGAHSRQKFRTVQIITNFYHVDIKPIQQIHIFKLKFTPAIALDDRKTRVDLLQSVIGQIKKNISDPVFSGFNIYSTRSPLSKQFTVKNQTHQLLIKQVKVLDVKKNPNILVHFLNNGLRNLMTKLNYVQIGNTGKYFNIKNKDKIDNLFMFSGFKANFMQLERGIFLRVDTAKKIVRNQTVLQYIDQIYRQNQEKNKDQRRQILKQNLINKIIMTNYGKPRYLKITDIEFNDIDNTFIPGQNISIRQYYATKYNLKIQNAKQPMLVIEERKKKDEKVLMIPQICLMTGIPDDFDQFRRKKISEATIKSADERKIQIHKLMQQIKNTSQVNSLKQIGISINPQMQRFQAKIIPAPRIRLGKEQKIQSGKQSFFNLFAQPIYACKHSLKVGIVSFRTADLGQMLDVFQQTSKRLGVEFKSVKIGLGEFDSRKAIQLIDDGLYKACEKQDCNICLIVIPNQLKTQYKKIKQQALLHNKVVSQVVTEGTLRKNGLKSIATKILLQLIAKRGNTLWVPESTLKTDRTMLIAFDTAKLGNRNVMGGVGTVNSTFSSITSKIDEYSDINNKMNCMLSMLLKLIDSYFKRNKQTPKQVVIFTNSCSNDQISLFNQFMVKPAITKMQQIYKTSKPNLTLVMVNTKTNERFFQSQGPGVKNVPAGTIISENIVSPNYDFFMVSQFATKGSTVPNHYKVIYNDSKMEEGVLQELIYSQCFNYVNWTGSIKVPGILQYAKKCVRFNTEVLETKKLCEQLESKLYFI